MSTSTMAAEPPCRHRQNLEGVQPCMAKVEIADVKKVDERDFRAEIGAALVKMRLLAGKTQDEMAREIGKDAAQVSRWEKGIERPHFDAYIAVEDFRWPMLAALAKLLDAELRMQIHPKQSA